MYYTDFGQDYDDSERNPWYQRYPLDPSFPFIFIKGSFKSYPFHWHKYMEIVYVKKGHLEVSFTSKKYSAKEGDIVFINSELIHGYFNCSDDAIFFIYLFGLELFDQSLIDLCEQVNKMVVFNRKTMFTENDDAEVYRKVKNILRLVSNEYLKKKEGYRLAIKKHFYSLALIFLRDIPKNQTIPAKTKRTNSNFLILERTLSYIYANYDNPEITLDSVSKIACLSKFYFSRFFRDRTGITFHTYLSRYRINRAQKLLSETDKTITDIVYECGFISQKTFNRLFKMYTSVSPSSYRINFLAKDSPKSVIEV